MFGWVEIPVSDMDRAIAFYEEVFKIKIDKNVMGDLIMGWFPFADPEAPGSGGSLVKHPEFYHPSDSQGVLVYFSSITGDLQNELDRVESAGGTVLSGKKQISDEHGFMALFLDTEGNRVALHSRG